MSDPLVTLTTDFGEGSPYVGALKGALLSVNPSVRLVDLTHRIPPQDLLHTRVFLSGVLPFFPPGSLHIIVVDPGVGSDRALLHVETGGMDLLVPDHGCWPSLGPDLLLVRRLEDRRYWRASISSTFHGRDILAPVAGHLSRGLDPGCLGPKVSPWMTRSLPEVVLSASSAGGEIVFIDNFGNLLTNIPGAAVFGPIRGLQVGGSDLTNSCRWVRTYGDASPGTLVALVSSMGTLELAVVQGSAAHKLGAALGMSVRVAWGNE